MNLYQAFLKGKNVKTHTAFVEIDVEIDNALVEDIPIVMVNNIPFTSVKAKSLEVSDFFEDLMTKQSPRLVEKNPNLNLARLGIYVFHLYL